MLNETLEQDSTSNSVEDSLKILPVHLRDYTDDINAYLEKFEPYCRMLNEEVSKRQYMWNIFSAIVASHIKEYTVPQYGDYPNDNLTTFSADDCLKNISRYVARFNSNSRGHDEMLSDLLKIAHYAGTAYLKLRDYEKLFAKTTESSEETSGVADGK